MFENGTSLEASGQCLCSLPRLQSHVQRMTHVPVRSYPYPSTHKAAKRLIGRSRKKRSVLEVSMEGVFMCLVARAFTASAIVALYCCTRTLVLFGLHPVPFFEHITTQARSHSYLPSFDLSLHVIGSGQRVCSTRPDLAPQRSIYISKMGS